MVFLKARQSESSLAALSFAKALQLNYVALCGMNFDEYFWCIKILLQKEYEHIMLLFPLLEKLAPGFLINKVLQVGLELIIMYVSLALTHVVFRPKFVLIFSHL